MKLHRNIKIFLNYCLGPLLFIWLSWSIWRQVDQQPHLRESWAQIRGSLASTSIFKLLLVLLLMPLNWAIEALKWKRSIRHLQDISFFNAFKAILAGVSFSVSTPNRIGEYLGRVLYMEEDKRIKAVSLTMLGSLSQLLITLVMGFAGLCFLRPLMQIRPEFAGIWFSVVFYGVLAVTVFLLIFYFRISWLIRWISIFPRSRVFSKWVDALEDCDTGLLLQLLGLSAIRYMVFAIQYLLLFSLFRVDIGLMDGWWGVSVSFLILAIIPTFAIAELAQRGYITQTIIGLFSMNLTGILLATASIWFINLVIPAIAGSVLILLLKRIWRGNEDGSKSGEGE
jgi:hypothetical protein